MSSSIDSSNLFRVDGMVAVITGGGSGIGLTMARTLALNGAQKVYILGRRLEVLQTAAQEHPSLVPIRCDVTSKQDLQAAVDHITAETGHVNLVVANSGTLGPGARFEKTASVSEMRRALFTDYPVDEMNDTLALNVTAAFLTMTAFLELLDAGNRKGGFSGPGAGGVPAVQSQVLFTVSVSAFSRHWMSPPAYAASKAALTQLTRLASSQLARFGIRVNAIAPGLYPSDLATFLTQDRKPEEETISDDKFIPARRFGCDEEMAGAILYLASRTGGYTNGSILLTDGGRISVMPSSY